jgi:hypothetical protein
LKAKTIYTASSKSEKESMSASIEGTYKGWGASMSAKVSADKSSSAKLGNVKTKSIFS